MNFKELIEKRNALVEKANKLFETADTEKRALTADEMASYEAISKEIKDIDKTLNLAKEARSFELAKAEEKQEARSAQEKYEMECRAFATFVRENRADNWTVTANGTIIPKTIANKIIETVENLCPIYAKATKYRVKGELVFPKYDESTDKVQMGYQAEFGTITAHAGKFTPISLKGYLAAALTLISKSLINNATFDLTSYVITKVAEAIARFLEHELLLGTGANAAITGCVGTNPVTAATAGKVVAEDLIDLQMKVPEVYQANASWIMNTKTLGAIRKLKDGNGQFMLQPDIRQGFGYVLLGKHVDISDNMADIGTSSKANMPIVYGDFSGVYVNVHEDINMQILVEKYAEQHALGVVAWIEIDGKPVEVQKIATLSA